MPARTRSKNFSVDGGGNSNYSVTGRSSSRTISVNGAGIGGNSSLSTAGRTSSGASARPTRSVPASRPASTRPAASRPAPAPATRSAPASRPAPSPAAAVRPVSRPVPTPRPASNSSIPKARDLFSKSELADLARVARGDNKLTRGMSDSQIIDQMDRMAASILRNMR